MRPRPKAAAMHGGTLAWARAEAARTNEELVASSSNARRLNSAVQPVGPAAAPIRARRKVPSTVEAVSTTGDSGWKAKNAGSMESYGWSGLRAGSCNSARVAGVSGAKGPETNAELAAESSPWPTNRAARSARRAGSAGAAGGGASVTAGMHAAADSSSASHRPAWESTSRARHSGLVSL